MAYGAVCDALSGALCWSLIDVFVGENFAPIEDAMGPVRPPISLKKLLEYPTL